VEAGIVPSPLEVRVTAGGARMLPVAVMTAVAALCLLGTVVLMAVNSSAIHVAAEEG
jgi:hypothetical protein